MKFKWSIPLLIAALLGIVWAIHPKLMCGTRNQEQTVNRTLEKLSEKDKLAAQGENGKQGSILTCPSGG